MLLSLTEGLSGLVVCTHWALTEAEVIVCRREVGDVLGLRDDMVPTVFVHPQDPGFVEARRRFLGRGQLSVGDLLVGFEALVIPVAVVLVRGQYFGIIAAGEVESVA